MAGAKVGVDVGGTFTDFAVVLPDGRRLTLKVPSTPHNPAAAVLAGLERLAREHGLEPASVAVFAHGSTVATRYTSEWVISNNDRQASFIGYESIQIT